MTLTKSAAEVADEERKGGGGGRLEVEGGGRGRIRRTWCLLLNLGQMLGAS